MAVRGNKSGGKIGNKGNVNAKGRPFRLLEPETLEKFIYAINCGATYILAAKHAGISSDLYYELKKKIKNYLDKGIDSDGNIVDENHPLLKVYQSIEQAHANRALRWLNQIEEASQMTWQAAAWKLERCHPEDFVKRELDIEKKVDDTTEQLKEIKELISKCMK